MKHGWLWLVVSVAVGGLQAWDSGAWAAGTMVAVLTGAAIAIVAVSLVVKVSFLVRVIALIVGVVLLTVARMLSPVSLNELHLSLFPAALVILFLSWRPQANASGATHGERV